MFKTVLLILAILIGLAIIIGLSAANRSYRAKGERGEKPPSTGFGVLLALLIVGAVVGATCITTVSPRAVAIKTGFGKYQGTLNSGLHFKAPWESTEEFETTVNTMSLKGDDNAVPVTFKGGGSGKINATTRWRISEGIGTDGARSLWDSYKSKNDMSMLDRVTEELVRTDTAAVLLDVANDYTPNDARTAQGEMAAKAKTLLEDKLERYGVVMDSVSIVSMPLDGKTQASLDKIVAAQNDIERAEADQKRAKIDNETAKLRAESGALSDKNLARYCLEVTNAWKASENGNLPATWNCLGGASDTPVIVNSGK